MSSLHSFHRYLLSDHCAGDKVGVKKTGCGFTLRSLYANQGGGR